MNWLLLCSGRLSLPVLCQLAWLFPLVLAADWRRDELLSVDEIVARLRAAGFGKLPRRSPELRGRTATSPTGEDASRRQLNTSIEDCLR